MAVRDQALKRVAGLDADALALLTQSSDTELVRWMALQAHPEKRGKLSAATETPPEGLWSVANHPCEWIRRVQGTESRYYQGIGSAEALMLKAADLGRPIFREARTQSFRPLFQQFSEPSGPPRR